ncbi:NAC domain-containing protein 17 [Brachypodium distachyon]|uniref:NAC domain-containing protein n=1 Tax=Brachypodium distachyon TaxID=15368 RepID=A0A0Q3N5X1_BRADI|nr:NAC domain-containing protein 17 [Brachypodium distachyon]KQK12110.1 hypothetical protein BRADI_1g01683v3 [Brachypodium distachyon]|eukprot:XP_010229406.1 NAC domain-containing protein 17 [Brachypodium distachyon]
MAAPGCTFEPSEQELTDICLHGKITGAGRDVGAIHVADVYSADPETLAKSFAPAPGTGRGDKEPEWYFFSPVHYASKKKNSGRRARIIGGDSNKKWHSEIGAVPVEGSAVGGHKVNLTYMVRSNASEKHERAGWILAEFGIAPEHGGGQLELCKLHRSPHFQETAAGSKKRKAAAADELYAADRRKNLCLRQEMPEELEEMETMEGGAAAVDLQEEPVLDDTARWMMYLETQRMYFSDDIQGTQQQQQVPILDDTWRLALEEIERQLLSDDETLGGAGQVIDPAEEDESGAGMEQQQGGGGGCDDEDDARMECTYEELFGIDGDVEDDYMAMASNAAAAAACEGQQLHVAAEGCIQVSRS